MPTTIDTLNELTFLSALYTNREETLAGFIAAKADEKANTYKTDLYLCDLTTNNVKRMTSSGSVRRFLFEDERTVLFTDVRTKEEREKAKEGLPFTSVYRLSADGGEALPFFTLPFAANRLERLEDGRFLVTVSEREGEADLYGASCDKRREALKAEKEQADFEVLETLPFWLNGSGFLRQKRERLYLFDPAAPTERALRPLTAVDFDVSGFDYAGEGNKLLVWGAPVARKMPLTESLVELDLSTGERTRLLDQGLFSLYHAFRWGGDCYILASDMSDYGLNQSPRLYRREDDGRFRLFLNREIQLGNSVGTDAAYGPNRSFIKRGDRLFITETIWHRAVVNEVTSDGAVLPYAWTDGSICGFVPLDDACLAIVFRDMKPQELCRLTPLQPEQRASLPTYDICPGEIDGPGADAPFFAWPDLCTTPLTDFNRAIDALRPERFTFDRDGTTLEGFVLLPEKAEGPRRVPVILDIHGGPKTAYGDVYFHEMQLWASQGFAVIFMNPRGSSGRGDRFSDIRGCYGGKDYEDIMAFTDEVLTRYPVLDPDRMGVTGGSYGGFMTNWIVTHTDRFRAAATQRSISNWISFYGVSDIGFYFATDQNATDMTQDDAFTVMWEHSPLKYIRRAVTPTLVIHAQEDVRCPLEQGLQFYSGLADNGIETRLVLFKGETHELSRSGRPKGRKKRLNEITAWLMRHVRGEEYGG